MKIHLLSLPLFAALVLLACAGDKKESSTTSSQQPTTPQEAINQAQQAMKDANLQQPVEPVNFRKLQEVLPEKASGFERTKLSGESGGAMNIKFSKAEAKYKNGEGKNLQLDILDTGGLGMTMMSMAAWSTITIDKEDENGYERTGTLGGYKSFEKFRTNGSHSELSVIVENRFVVSASCRGCEIESIRELVQALDLGMLKSL